MSDQTVGNVLRRHGIQPAPQRSQNTTWREFIESHVAVLAGIDFFTVEVLTWRGLVTYYVLFSSTWRAGASAGRGSRGIQGKGNVLLFPSRRVGAEGRSPAENDSADCSDTTAAPHDYFGCTPTQTVISVFRRLAFCSENVGFTEPPTSRSS